MAFGFGFALTAIAKAVGFTPRSLFTSGEQGVWFDPSDLSTLYQDAAGTTPVTAVEQPVGRMLDKSGRGNHATQATTTSRPVLSARVNLLTGTETLATQTVTTRATTQTLRFEGTGSITLSGTATGTYSAGSHSITTTAGNLTLTVSGTVTKADLRATNMGVGLPAYQRVNTATDYETQGFPYYLRFDGVDDGLVTPSINFTATDKMTVFAGLRKISDASTGFIAELSFDYAQFNGSFAVWGTGVDPGYRFGIRGNLGAPVYSAQPFQAPVSNVLSCAFDIGGLTIADEVRPKVNGAIPSIEIRAAGPAGTGNYGNYPLFIGRRGVTTNPFAGNLYGLIVRGAQSTAQQIASAEAWVNQRTGAY